MPSTMYTANSANATRKPSFLSESWNACAVPWNVPRMPAGSLISASACEIASTASPRAIPGARLNEIVTDGN